QEIPLRIASVPRGETIGYALDLDGDGMPEWVLENQRVRATFSARDGGRWMEFVWKDTGANFLPEQGDLAGAGSVEVRTVEGGLEFKSAGWTRTVRLNGARLTVEQTSTLPAEVAQAGKRDGVSFEIARESAERRTYSLGK